MRQLLHVIMARIGQSCAASLVPGRRSQPDIANAQNRNRAAKFAPSGNSTGATEWTLPW